MINDHLLRITVCLIVAILSQSIAASKIVKEDLLIIQDFGIQLSSYSIEGKEVSQRFVDISRVRDFVLNESLDWFTVDMYLAFIVEREKKLIIPFMVKCFQDLTF